MADTIPKENPASAALQAALIGLYQANGSPSERSLAETIGRRRITQATIREILRGDGVVGWPKVRLLVEALGGNLDDFQALWSAAHQAQPAAQQQPPTSPTAQTKGSEAAARRNAANKSEGRAGSRNSDLSEMISRYRDQPPRPDERPEKDTPVGVADLVAETARVWTDVQRLSDLTAPKAADALRAMTTRRAALVLAELPHAHARRTAKALGWEVLVDLAAALPPSPQRDRLVELSPDPPPGSPDVGAGRPGSPSPADEVGRILSNHPDLAREWGWLPE